MSKRSERQAPVEDDEAQDDIVEVSGEPRAPLPVVAIVGRPNVGKSALFNRLVGQRISIVEDKPGVTRDRIYADTDWNGRPFTLVDTGGMIPSEDERLHRAVLDQARTAVSEATLVIFLVDGTSGVHGLEEEIAEVLRRSGKPVLLVVNKVDNQAREIGVHEFYALGLGEPWPVSAMHGIGTGDLLDEVVTLLPHGEAAEDEGAIRLAIVGRPNVGKSSLLNALVGEERSIVHDMPGTTRDAVDTRLDVDGQPFVLVDTAGLRRRAKIDESVEYYSSVRSLHAIKACDIALLVLDGSEPVSAQDKRVAGYVQEANKAVIVVVNKWDVVRQDARDEAVAREDFARDLFAELAFMAYAPVVFLSAKTGENLDEIWDAARDVYGEYTRRVETSALNRVVQEALMMRPPPTFKGQQLKVFYASQKTVGPPTFVFKVNSPKLLHFSYRRYLENHIRRAFGFIGTPIELILKAR